MRERVTLAKFPEGGGVVIKTNIKPILACLKHQDTDIRGFSETGSESQASCAAADDDKREGPGGQFFWRKL